MCRASRGYVASDSEGLMLERVGISLKDGLLKQFDGPILAKGYANRSDAVRALINDSPSSAVVRIDRPGGAGRRSVLAYDHNS